MQRKCVCWLTILNGINEWETIYVEVEVEIEMKCVLLRFSKSGWDEIRRNERRDKKIRWDDMIGDKMRSNEMKWDIKRGEERR